MPNWMLKTAVQGSISFLPKSQSFNYLFQRFITKSLELNVRSFGGKLTQCKKHLENYFSNSQKNKAFTVLELGTGWYPIIPIGLYLCGASKIWTIDKTPLLNKKRVEDVLHLFISLSNEKKLIEILPYVNKRRISKLKNILKNKNLSTDEILNKLNIYLIVCDACNIKLKKSSVDLFVSNNTLEHIPEKALLKIFIEFKRVASKKAVMSHFIDMSDHYANFDKSITYYNFLKYSNLVWKLFNNPLQYQNRLHISDYHRIHKTAGFKIISECIKRGDTKELGKINIAKEFAAYPKNELTMLNSWLVSVPKSPKS